MRVKICGIKTEHDVTAALNAGADALGFLVGQIHASQDFILQSTAARLAAMVPPFVTPVLVTHLTDPDQVMELIEKTSITTVQLHGGSTPEQVGKIKAYLHGKGRVIAALHVPLPGEITPAPEPYFEAADMLLLDSVDPEKNKVGGTGICNDWQTCAAFCARSPLPVALAGGLSPQNVAEAIRTVKPFAVDANSSLKDYEGMVDAKLAKEFVQTAKNTP